MFCAIDIGNSAIKVGSFYSETQSEYSSFNYKRQVEPETNDELFERISSTLQCAKQIGICSVVPNRLDKFLQFLNKKFPSIHLTVIEHRLMHEVQNLYHPPESVGIDRLIGVYESAKCYGHPVVTVDMGTATTINVVNTRNEFVGGVIFPGFGTSLTALSRETTLSEVQLDSFEFNRMVANSTKENIQVGIYLNQLYTIEKYLEKLSVIYSNEIKVVLTGGNAFRFTSYIHRTHFYRPHLVLDGIYRLCTNSV